MTQENAQTVGVVDGTSGKDKIKGKYKDGDGDRVSNGSDTISSGAGNDFVNAGKGDDTIIYTSGNDTYIGGKGQDTLDLSKYDVHEVTFSQKGKHVIIETPDGKITLKKQIQKDLFTGKVMEKIVFADGVVHEAEIKFRAETDNFLVNGTSGDDVIDANYMDTQGNQITDGVNVISAGAGNDYVVGSASDDSFIYTSGNDSYTGGAGEDSLGIGYQEHTVSFRFLEGGEDLEITTPGGVIILRGQGSVNPQGDEGTIENFSVGATLSTAGQVAEMALTGQGTSGDDVIYGAQNHDNAFYGYSGNDEYWGYHGDDYFSYSSGNDFIHGGEGYDLVDFGSFEIDELSFSRSDDSNDNLLYVHTDNGTVEIYDVFSEDRTNAVEGFQFKNNRAVTSLDEIVARLDQVNGTSGDDVIDFGYVDNEGNSVGSGDDIISTGAGDDVAYGYSGNDTFIYTSGNDTYYGGFGGTNTVDLSKYDLDDVVISSYGLYGSSVRIETADGTVETPIGDYSAISNYVFADQTLTYEDMTEFF